MGPGGRLALGGKGTCLGKQEEHQREEEALPANGKAGGGPSHLV